MIVITIRSKGAPLFNGFSWKVPAWLNKGCFDWMCIVRSGFAWKWFITVMTCKFLGSFCHWSFFWFVEDFLERWHVIYVILLVTFHMGLQFFLCIALQFTYTAEIIFLWWLFLILAHGCSSFVSRMLVLKKSFFFFRFSNDSIFWAMCLSVASFFGEALWKRLVSLWYY